jgi:hypothetical protein
VVQPSRLLRKLKREVRLRGRYSSCFQMQVKSFTYERSCYGTDHQQRFFSMEKMGALAWTN